MKEKQVSYGIDKKESILLMFEWINKKDSVGSVIPAKAGIQFNLSGFRLKAGMTTGMFLTGLFI